MSATSFSAAVREYKTVRLWRTPTGFGFSLTGQYPCVLTHVVDGSPAFKAGLKVGDYLIMVNGLNVVKCSHDSVVAMVASCAEYVILQVAQRTATGSSSAGVQCTCSLNCQSMTVPNYPLPNNTPYGSTVSPRFECCGVIYVGFLKLPLPANANASVFTRLLSNSLNHFLMNKNLILMQPLILSASRQAICLSDVNNKTVGYNFILNSVAYVGTIAESPSNMFGVILHCPPNPICVCHVFSTSLTRQQEQYLRLKSPPYYSAPDVVRYINSLITSIAKCQPLCDSSNYPNFSNNNPPAVSNPRRTRHPPPPNFEAEIFVDNFQFPAGGVYTVSERNGSATGSLHLDDAPRTRGFSGKPPRHIGRVTSNTSSASSATHTHEPQASSNGSFDMRQAAMALARSRSLSRYYRKGVRGGSSRSSGSDDGRFGRGGGSSGGSGSFRVRYGSQRHKHHRSDRHRRRQDSLSGGSGSGARLAISDETTTTTSTTTASSSVVANSRRHYGHLGQTSGQYRSRSIDSLVNASKEENIMPSDVKPACHPHERSEKSGVFLSIHQQQHVIIDGPYLQADQRRGQVSGNFVRQSLSIDANELALNSLLSPRYTSLNTNASETDLDYEESQAVVNGAGVAAGKSANNPSVNVFPSSSQHNQPPENGCSENHKKLTPHPADACEARSSTASVETRTEGAGSTLSLPISSASTAGLKSGAQTITFESILQDKTSLELFRKFLKSQVSDENLEFVLACDNFRTLLAPDEVVVNEAKVIYQQFVSQHAKQPVNLTWQIVSSIRRALLTSNVHVPSPTSPKECAMMSIHSSKQTSPGEIARDIFDAARDHVYRLLKKDCYPRFVHSDYYKELLGEKSASIGENGVSTATTETNLGFRPSGLRLSSRKNRPRNTGSTSSAPVNSNGGSITWNPAKLLSHIIGRAKNKPVRQKGSAATLQSFRVTFPDGTTETVATDEIKSGFVTSLSDCLGPLCAARGMSVFLCAIYQHGSELSLDHQLSAASFNGRDLIIEQQAAFVVFYFSGSSLACRRLLVRAKPSRRITDVLQWDERKGDDAVIVKEVWCIDSSHSVKCDTQLATLTKLNTASCFEGLVRDVENCFVIAIAAGRAENYDSSSICNLVKSHFDIHGLPKFEDVLNAVTSSHSWHTFDEYGRINLAKAISQHWRSLKQALSVGEALDSNTTSKDESDYLEGDDLIEGVSLLDQPENADDPLVVNEPRSRRPILSSCSTTSFGDTCSTHSKPAAVHCRLVRGAQPLGEILADQYHTRNGSPCSIETSFNNDRNVGVNNLNYEIVDAQIVNGAGTKASRFVRIGSVGDLRNNADGSPGRENIRHAYGFDENASCLISDEAFVVGHNQTSPYARRLPRPLQMPKVSVATDDAVLYGGIRSSTPSPTTHRLIYNPPNDYSPVSALASSHADGAKTAIRITESTL